MRARGFIRILLSITLVLIIIAQTGCKKKEPEPTIAEGYTLYDDAEWKFSLEYPENWLFLYDGADLEAIMSALIDAGDLAAADRVDGFINNPEGLQGYYAWYDINNAADSVVPVVSLRASMEQWLAQTGITSAVYINMLKDNMGTSYPDYYPGFELIKEPAKTTFGGNAFASYVYGYDGLYCRLNVREAYIDANGYLHFYQIVIPADIFDDKIKEYEKMLGSLTLDF